MSHGVNTMSMALKKFSITLISFFLLAVPLSSYADDLTSLIGSTFITPNEMKWTAAPIILPVGAQIAVLEGDLNKIGAYIFQLRFPPNYKIPPHWFMLDNHVTVISGVLNVGNGDKFDIDKGKALPSGSFAIFRANDHVYAWVSQETIIQVSGIGPWTMQLVNPQ